MSESVIKSTPPDDPGRASLAVSHALRLCWASLPADGRTVAAAEAQFRRLCERALRDLREDAAAFPPGAAEPVAIVGPIPTGPAAFAAGTVASADPAPGRVPEENAPPPIDLDALDRADAPPPPRPDWGGPNWRDGGRPLPPTSATFADEEEEDDGEGPTYRLTGG